MSTALDELAQIRACERAKASDDAQSWLIGVGVGAGITVLFGVLNSLGDGAGVRVPLVFAGGFVFTVVCSIGLAIKVARYSLWLSLGGAVVLIECVLGSALGYFIYCYRQDPQRQAMEIIHDCRGKAQWKPDGKATELSFHSPRHPRDEELKLIAALSACKELRKVSIDTNWEESELTDAGLSELAVFVALEELKCAAPRVTGIGFRRLGTLRQLAKIDLSKSAISDTGLEALAVLPNVRKLKLLGTKITVEGLQYLAAHKELRYLALDSCMLTEQGLSQLKQCQSLQELRVQREGVFYELQLAEVRAALPQIRVELLSSDDPW